MLTPTPLYRELSSVLSAIDNCRKSGNNSWLDRHESTIKTLVDFLPSGSGIDNGVTLDRDASTPEKLVFTFGFHHMNDTGMYDGWTQHTLTVKPSLQFGIDIRISGRDRNQIKDYLYEIFQNALTDTVWQSADCVWHYSAYEQFAQEGGN